MSLRPHSRTQPPRRASPTTIRFVQLIPMEMALGVLSIRALFRSRIGMGMEPTTAWTVAQTIPPSRHQAPVSAVTQPTRIKTEHLTVRMSALLILKHQSPRQCVDAARCPRGNSQMERRIAPKGCQPRQSHLHPPLPPPNAAFGSLWIATRVEAVIPTTASW